MSMKNTLRISPVGSIRSGISAMIVAIKDGKYHHYIKVDKHKKVSFN